MSKIKGQAPGAGGHRFLADGAGGEVIGDDGGELLPLSNAVGELGATGFGECEVLPARPAFAGSPRDGDKVVLLEPGQQWIEGSALDVPEACLGEFGRDRIPVGGPLGHGAQHAQPQNSAEPLAVLGGGAHRYIVALPSVSVYMAWDVGSSTSQCRGARLARGHRHGLRSSSGTA